MFIVVWVRIRRVNTLILIKSLSLILDVSKVIAQEAADHMR